MSSTSWTGQVGTPTRLLLLRHGQTELSVHRRYSGSGDPELTALGHVQAAEAAARLAGVPGIAAAAPVAGVVARLAGVPEIAPAAGARLMGVPEMAATAPAVDARPATVPEIAAVLTSPLRRARQTAAAVADATGAPMHVRDRLIETDFGAWEGLTFVEARARDPELHDRWLDSTDVAPPGGESFAVVGERVAAERAAVLAEYPGATVVLVSHVTPIKMLLRDALLGGPSILYRLHLDLASLSIVDLYPDGGASVRLVNDTSYLISANAR